MNCNDVRELLPLYAGEDLGERRSDLVSTHLATCVDCTALADEYTESRLLMKQFSPGVVSDGVYDGIRQRVLNQIASEATAPARLGFFGMLLRPRIGWAVATAILIAVSAVTLYFVVRRPFQTQQVADTRPTPVQPPKDEPNPGSADDAPGATAPPPSTDRNNAKRSKPNRTFRTPQRETLATQATPKNAAPEEPSSVPEESARAENPTEPIAAEKVLRFEMQTRDPNIRIIWLSHQRFPQDSKRNHTKGI